MELYNERICLWCWEYSRGEQDDSLPLRPSAWKVFLYHGDGEPGIEHICNDCHDSQLQNLLADNEEDKFWDKVEVVPFAPDPPNVFKRGDRVEIVRVNRPPLVGTIVHCYYSHRRWTAQVNIVIDGKKWPVVYPAHIVQKRVLNRPAA